MTTANSVPLAHNKQWTVGSGATSDDWKKSPKKPVDIVTSTENYPLFISGIVPRPVAFIATKDKDGNNNLAPYSFFNIVSSNPPVFTIGISPSALRDGDKKDTLTNILESGELTINIISDWFIDAANYTAINAPEGVDEFELAGLHPAESKYVKAPHVAESGFSIEAKLLSYHQWQSKVDGSKTGTLVIVEGVHAWVREALLNESGKAIDVEKYRPVGRLGGVSYTTITESGYPIKRPLWEEDKP